MPVAFLLQLPLLFSSIASGPSVYSIPLSAPTNMLCAVKKDGLHSYAGSWAPDNAQERVRRIHRYSG